MGVWLTILELKTVAHKLQINGSAQKEGYQFIIYLLICSHKVCNTHDRQKGKQSHCFLNLFFRYYRIQKK